ncbi:hypothetical protein BDV25DRAFT_149423 [Aspergillus avenaceus]|uniref:HIT-type domain-containing protein n=1 Tax=Aspergillus avenaceus TaxID=36643 RepID=A0A5N6U453_ASPAV|nr:hypothetical protein BDV25DRAFT_149423 [Aspergillus avenaceus]
MYHVEVLPNATTHLTPGWTYVPDRGFDPSKAAITPTIGRKRGIRDPGNRGDLSSRQTNAIIRHLAELDRENHKDVHIPVPVKQKDAATRGTRGKVTSNVRRILQSQKSFRNYLDDEEAALAQAAHASQRPPAKIAKSSLRRSSTPATTPSTSTPKPDSRRKQSTQQSAESLPQKHVPIDRAPTETKPTETTEPMDEENEESEENEEKEEKVKVKGLIKSEHDNDPLLRSYIPSAPSDRIMQALLSEPPLTYNAARAGPPVTMQSQRHFCCVCGYWGKIRCRNCHSRTCGLDCYKVHEDSRCGAFY